MAPVHFVIPGDLSLPTGGYAYDRRVLALAAQAQLDLQYLKIPGSFPSPAAEDLQETARLIGLTAADDVLLIDGLALGAMPPEFVRALNRTIVALVHHPLGLESGLPPERAAFLIANEKAVLALCAAVIVTSHDTARILADDFAVPSEKITVAEPGNDRCPRASGSGNAAPTIVAVGAVSPRKGYDVLIDALAPLRAQAAWELIIAGATDRDPDTYAALKRRIGRRRLGARVTFAGSLSDAALAQLFHVTDMFVMASRYEGYGMALTEALAHGLPIVTTLSGAAAMQAPDAAALKVPVNDPVALKVALAHLIGDRDLRQRMADAAWAAAQSLPRWEDTVARIAETLHAVMAGQNGASS
ncbi:MAG: glycosyltransferase family 4 protein [Beijerinckiaceae bacterium]